MAWASLDDQFHANPKVVAVGLDGAGLYARSISYAASYLTDGFVPDGWARETAPKRIHSRLVNHKLWTRDDALGGYWIHDYLSFNPTRAEVERKRLEAAERKRKSRERHSDGHNDVTPDVTRDSSVTSRPRASGRAAHAPSPRTEPTASPKEAAVGTDRSEETPPARSPGRRRPAVSPEYGRAVAFISLGGWTDPDLEWTLRKRWPKLEDAEIKELLELQGELKEKPDSVVL